MSKVLKSNHMNKCLGCFTCQQVCAAINHKSYSDAESAIKVRSFGGLGGNFFAIHCMACADERACIIACPTDALAKRKGGGITLNDKKCIKCRKCATACIVKAIFFVGEDTLPIICRHCGFCTKYCPHNCLQMEEKKDD